MSATQESGAYLGGIGVMLGAANVCPACGQVHDGRKFGFKHRSPRECPRVVIGSFPFVSLPSPPEPEAAPIRVPPADTAAPRRNREPDPPSAVTPALGDAITILRPGRDSPRGRALGVPWLPPPDLGEVY